MEETIAFLAEPIQESKLNPNLGVPNSAKNYCWDYFREDAQFFCTMMWRLFYFLFGVIQFFAIWDWLAEIYHTSSLFIAAVSLFLAFLPCIGTGFGIWATCNVWGWELSDCLIIFLTPYVIVNAPILFIVGCEIFKDIKRWKMEEKQLNN